jgi:hypothetical protein
MANPPDDRERDAAAALSRIRSGVRSAASATDARERRHFWWGAVDIASSFTGASDVDQGPAALLAPDAAIYDPILPLLAESRALPLPHAILNSGSLEARARLATCLRFNDVALAQRLSRSPIFAAPPALYHEHAHHHRVDAGTADAAALAAALDADPHFRAAASEVGLTLCLSSGSNGSSGSSGSPLATIKALALALTALRLRIARARGRTRVEVSTPPRAPRSPNFLAAAARPLGAAACTAARAPRTSPGGRGPELR